MKLFERLLARYRLMRWRKRLKSGRGFSLRLRDPRQFLRNLEALDVKYVVLRWYDDLPQVLDGNSTDDIDMLVQHGSLARIATAVPFFNFIGNKVNKVKFDIYSDSGRTGLSYRKMPYYPPVRARHLLDTRVADPRGWYRIALQEYIPALTYHLTYHKRETSGLKLSFDSSPVATKKNYPALLQAEALREGFALPPLETLLQAHQWLREQAWSMPFDLIRRWPGQDAWLEQLYRYEVEQMQHATNGAVDDDLVVLVTRREAREHACEKDILDTLARLASSVEHAELTEHQVGRLLWWARGGNWLAAKQYVLSPPTLVITCRVPGGVTMLKENIRKELSQRHGRQNWLHGTDDVDEARYYLALLEGELYSLPVRR